MAVSGGNVPKWQIQQMKKEMQDEGHTFTTNEIMNLAANKYKQLVEEGVWNAPSPEEERPEIVGGLDVADVLSLRNVPVR